MPEYYSNALLAHKGGVVKYGEKLTLTEEQAAALGSKVIPAEVANPDKPVNEMTIKELKPLAKAANVENYTAMNRSQLVEALSAKQVEQPELTDVIADEPSSD